MDKIDAAVHTRAKIIEMDALPTTDIKEYPIIYAIPQVGTSTLILWRYKEKNGIEDVKKARKYNDMLLGYLEEDAAAARNTSSVSKTGHFKMVDF